MKNLYLLTTANGERSLHPSIDAAHEMLARHFGQPVHRQQTGILSAIFSIKKFPVARIEALPFYEEVS